jgi:hypothetical protein
MDEFRGATKTKAQSKHVNIRKALTNSELPSANQWANDTLEGLVCPAPVCVLSEGGPADFDHAL